MKVPKYAIAALIALTTSLVIAPSCAALTVIDPSNLAQNVLSAARALEQINNQIRQIEQQTAMLAKSPLQMSDELTRSVAKARALFDTARGIAFDLDQISDSVRDLYPETFDDLKMDDVLARSKTWISQSRASLELAMRAQADAVASVQDAQGRIGAALDASASAEGQTGALQAGNQLLGLTSTQLAEIESLLAAQGRALASERMETLAREERAEDIRRRAFPVSAASATAPSRLAF